MGGFVQNLETIFHGLRTKLFAGATDLNILYQLVIVVAVPLVIFLVSGWLRRLVNRVLANVLPGDKHHLPQIRANLVDASAPLAASIILGIMSLVAQEAHWGHQIIYAAVDLLLAWVIIRLLTGLLVSPAWSKFFAVLIMAVAAMDIVGILDPTIEVLDRTGFNLGEGRLSLWIIIKTGVMLALLLPLSRWLSQVLQHRVEQIANLSPRVQVLLVKLGKTALYTLAIVIALRSVGFDFHLLAVFSGAVGLGVGFGLQKVVSNLVSGVIILMDNSIRPGDVIEVGGVFGWI
ncbi:MAG: mechanosensitive ion channel, partial [Syntrophales bacterium]|nr:mechanosensitive ion channel [Syntrophales bacterium]